MSKRQRGKFKQNAQEWYATPERAIPPLLQLLPPNTPFVEPCAGDGALASAVEAHGHSCVWAFDLTPKMAANGSVCEKRNAFDVDEYFGFSLITNPPFSKAKDLLKHWLTVSAGPVFLLHPHDWLCNLDWQWAMRHARAVAPICRVKWIPESRHQSAENFVWAEYLSIPRNADSGIVWNERQNQHRRKTNETKQQTRPPA